MEVKKVRNNFFNIEKAHTFTLTIKHVIKMTWEQCKNFGLIQIEPSNNTVRLYYNQWSTIIAQKPGFLYVVSASWQGNNLILRGYNQYDEPLVYVMTDFNSFQRIV